MAQQQSWEQSGTKPGTMGDRRGAGQSHHARPAGTFPSAHRLEPMGLVAGRVAHDLNNVLTSIVGYTEVLRRNPGGEAHDRAVANVGRAARRGASITQQLLALAGRVEDVTVPVDLASELDELRPVLEFLAGERVRTVVSRPDHPVMVDMAPGHAEQVLLNLVINACQAMQDGGALEVRLMTLPSTGGDDDYSAGWADLLVVDTGTGMTEEVKARCMQPFFTTKMPGQGTGLGLPTVVALAGEAGGHVDIQSAPGAGTTVTVRLPLTGTGAREPLRPGPAQPVWMAAKSGAGMRPQTVSPGTTAPGGTRRGSQS